jgi:hypothetical protein
MSEIERYIAVNNWMTVNCDMGRRVAAVVMTEFRVLSQHLFGRTTENHENSYGMVGTLDRILYVPLVSKTKNILSKR